MSRSDYERGYLKGLKDGYIQGKAIRKAEIMREIERERKAKERRN